MQGRARPLDVSGGQSKESNSAKLQFCDLCPHRFPPLSPPPLLLLILFLSCVFFSCLSESVPSYLALPPLSAGTFCSHPLPPIHTLLSMPSSLFPTLLRWSLSSFHRPLHLHPLVTCL